MDFFFVQGWLNCHGKCHLYVQIAYLVYHLMVKLPWIVSGVDGLLFKLGIVDVMNVIWVDCCNACG
jgi:hypothetical protein